MIARYQLGERAAVRVQTLDGNLSPTGSVAAPSLKVFAPNGSRVMSTTMPALDSNNVTGLYQSSVMLDDNFSTGVYSWRAEATVAGTTFVEEGMFEIVGGGGQDGAVVSLFFLEAPAVTHLLCEVDGQDDVLMLRNPRV